MENNPSRRSFFGKFITVSSGIILLPGKSKLQTPKESPIDSIIVNEFVKVAHSDLNRVKELLQQYPHLLNSSWDWGNGDFETAMGAAGHMGLKETANYLIKLGARYDIFVMTMLGKTSQVKLIIEVYPHLIDCVGPHGFTLLHHAKQGGAEGAELVDYFQSKGLTETRRKVFTK